MTIEELQAKLELKPLVVIDGKPTLYKHFELSVTLVELLPDPITLARCYRPGEQYAIVWYRDGSREVIPGAPFRDIRRSGRRVYYLYRGRQDVPASAAGARSSGAERGALWL